MRAEDVGRRPENENKEHKRTENEAAPATEAASKQTSSEFSDLLVCVCVCVCQSIFTLLRDYMLLNAFYFTQ